MFRSRKARDHVSSVVVALLLGSFLLLSCQPAQPVATPKSAEKAAAAVAAKPAETAVTPAETAEKPVKGGTLRLWLPQEPPTLDPQLAGRQQPNYNLYDHLIEMDNNLGITKEGLLRDWTVSGDGKAITFKVREGVKFQDGTDFDAAAVKFNIDRMKDPATKSTYRSNYDSVASVDVVDGATVRFTLSQADPVLLSLMATAGGQVVSPAAVKRLGQDFGRKPVGSGPFEFVEWIATDHITLKRFNGYWRKDKDGNQLPYLDQLVFMSIPDATVAAANLRSGQMDLMAGSLGFPPEQLAILKNDFNLIYTVGKAPTNTGVMINVKKPPLDNKALRQAVALAMDREAIAGFFGEGATVAASIFHPNNWGYDPQVGVFPPRDVVKAKAKMAEAGYSSGGPKVKLTSNTSNFWMKMAEIFKANLADIGLDADIEALAMPQWTSRTAAGTWDYQISIGAGGGMTKDPGGEAFSRFHSKSSRNTYGPYSNSKVDELLDKAGSIYDQRERTALYQEAAKLIVDDAPYMPALVLNVFAAKNKKVGNFVQYADNGDRLREVWLAK